jgi:hypothetical protein
MFSDCEWPFGTFWKLIGGSSFQWRHSLFEWPAVLNYISSAIEHVTSVRNIFFGGGGEGVFRKKQSGCQFRFTTFWQTLPVTDIEKIDRIPLTEFWSSFLHESSEMSKSAPFKFLFPTTYLREVGVSRFAAPHRNRPDVAATIRIQLSTAITSFRRFCGTKNHYFSH